MRLACLLLLACLTAACATGPDGHGWRGEGAEPFDGARAACKDEAAAQPAGAAQEAAFETCMAGKGWHRD